MPHNKVTQETINNLVESLEYSVHHYEETNYTIAIAKFPDGYVVASGFSACVDKANFNEELGKKYAIEDAKKKATNMLWQLEGYALYKQLK